MSIARLNGVLVANIAEINRVPIANIDNINGVALAPAFVAPTVEAGGPYAGSAGTPIQLDATVVPGTDLTPTLLWVENTALGGTFSATDIEDPTFTPDVVSGAYVL